MADVVRAHPSSPPALPATPASEPEFDDIGKTCAEAWGGTGAA